MNIGSRRPDFIIVGAPKAGTTSLYSYLCAHPDVYPSFYKETHFFSDEKIYKKGIEYYLSNYFKGAEKYICKGEATPAYLRMADVVIPRMKSCLNFRSLKIIFVLRDPVQRAWSHYLHRRRSLNEPLSFEDALAMEESRLKSGESFSGYFLSGLYGQQCGQWLSTVKRENCLFIKYEDLFSDIDEELEKVFNFLGVDPHVPIQKIESLNKAGQPRFRFIMKYIRDPDSRGKRVIKKIFPGRLRRELKTRIRQWNVAPYSVSLKPEMDAETANFLRKKYTSDIKKLESLTKWDCSDWKYNGN